MLRRIQTSPIENNMFFINSDCPPLIADDFEHRAEKYTVHLSFLDR